jgi:hypothetical protein
MKHRIGMAIVCLHISALLYVVIGGSTLLFGMAAPPGATWEVRLWIGMFAVCLVLAVGIEYVVVGLKQRKYWAWIAGMCIFAIYIPSAFLPLGAFGLWALLDSGSQNEFLRKPQLPNLRAENP